MPWRGAPGSPTSTHGLPTIQTPPADGNRTTGNGWTTTQYKHPRWEHWGQNWPHWWGGGWQPPSWWSNPPPWYNVAPTAPTIVTTPVNYGPGVYVSGGVIVYGA